MKKTKNTNKKPRIQWCTPVNQTLDSALEQAVKQDSHSSKSEFIRDSVRRRLEDLGYKPKIFGNQKK